MVEKLLEQAMFRMSKPFLVCLALCLAYHHHRNCAEGWSSLNYKRQEVTKGKAVVPHLWNRKDAMSSILTKTTESTVAAIVFSESISVPANAANELPTTTQQAAAAASPSVDSTEGELSEEERQKRQQEELKQRLRERRQLMEASRSSNSRQSYLDLSRQRAALYNTTSKAVSCPPNIPCL